MRRLLLPFLLAACGPAESPKPRDAGKVTLEFYDVKDLCRPPPDNGPYEGPRLDPTPYVPRPEDPNDVRPEAEDLVDAISSTIEPGSWDASDRSITSKNRVLVVRATAEIHERILHYLADLRAR